MMYNELIKQLRSFAEKKREFDNELFLEDIAADAIEELQKKLDVAYSNGYKHGVDDASEVDLVKKMSYWWIPVTERLPEIDMSYPHHEDYLVQYDSGNMDVASWSNVNWFWTDHVTEPHWNCVQFAEVIAWMPLPEPPEVET